MKSSWLKRNFLTGPIITSTCLQLTNKRVQDATVALLDFIYQHLEGSKNHARPAFCGLLIVLEHRAASPFGTEACWALDTKIIGWILHFLTDRSLTSTSMAVSSLLSYTSCILMTAAVRLKTIALSSRMIRFYWARWRRMTCPMSRVID